MHLFAQVSSSNFFRSSGSSRRAVAGGREAVIVNSDTEPSRSLAMDGSPAALRKISDTERTSTIISSEHNRTSSGKRAANLKNYESTLRGMESLRFNDERVQY